MHGNGTISNERRHGFRDAEVVLGEVKLGYTVVGKKNLVRPGDFNRASGSLYYRHRSTFEAGTFRAGRLFGLGKIPFFPVLLQ